MFEVGSGCECDIRFWYDCWCGDLFFILFFLISNKLH